MKDVIYMKKDKKNKVDYLQIEKDVSFHTRMLEIHSPVIPKTKTMKNSSEYSVAWKNAIAKALEDKANSHVRNAILYIYTLDTYGGIALAYQSYIEEKRNVMKSRHRIDMLVAVLSSIAIVLALLLIRYAITKNDLRTAFMIVLGVCLLAFPTCACIFDRCRQRYNEFVVESFEKANFFARLIKENMVVVNSILDNPENKHELNVAYDSVMDALSGHSI